MTDLPFHSVVKRMREIAKEFYDNDIKKYIQAIYNRLSDDEQSVFLKGLIPIIFEVPQNESVITPVTEPEEADFDIDVYNQVELIKLKSWVVKCFAIVCSIMLVFIIGYFIAETFLPTNKESSSEELIRFLKELVE